MIDLNDVLLAMSNIPVDDPIAEIWGRGLQGGYKIIEYTGYLPITISANGDALIDYRIYGNTVQSGTPTPENPIMPEGVGEPTENIFDGEMEFGYYDNDGLKQISLNWIRCKNFIRVNQNKTYHAVIVNNVGAIGTTVFARCYNARKEYIGTATQLVIQYYKEYAFNTLSDTEYVTFYISNSYSGLKIALFETTISKPYVPYGYKLPMTVSENYEYVFTGDESFSNSYGRYQFRLPKTAIATSNASNTSCNYFPYGTGLSRSGTFSFEAGIFTYFGVIDEYPTIPDFKQFLTDQYNAGTPMTLRYFLAPSYIPVYIGENRLDSVEGVSDYVDKSSGKIVRMIGEYTFTGDESFNKYGNSDVFYTSTTIDPVGITTVNTITMRCNHPAFTAIENKDTRYWLNPEADDICCFLPGGRSQVFLRSTSNFTTATECKAYLKTQYDNGTPVKISYWLKTPIEEEPPVPLPEIPAIDGETVIDYDGEPKPSQMYVKYKGKGRRWCSTSLCF